jgi:hypothetical protein
MKLSTENKTVPALHSTLLNAKQITTIPASTPAVNNVKHKSEFSSNVKRDEPIADRIRPYTSVDINYILLAENQSHLTI